MARIVQQRESGEKHILVGSGFGAYRSERPNWFWGSWVPNTQAGGMTMVAACDEEGKIGWFRSEDLIVVSVDGKSPSELLR